MMLDIPTHTVRALLRHQPVKIETDPTQAYHLLLLVTERITKTDSTSESSDLTSGQVEYGQLLDLEHILLSALEREQ